MSTTRHRETECPGCHCKLDASTSLHIRVADEDGGPKQGDYSVCVKCAQPMKYGKGLKLKAVNIHHLAKLLKKDRHLALTIESMRLQIEQRNEREGTDYSA